MFLPNTNKRLKTIFGLKRRPSWPQDKLKQPPREEIVIERPQHDLTIFKIHFGQLTVKLYSKGARVLRSEAIVWNSPGKVDMKNKQIQIHFENGGNEHYVKHQAKLSRRIYVRGDSVFRIKWQIGGGRRAGVGHHPRPAVKMAKKPKRRKF